MPLIHSQFLEEVAQPQRKIPFHWKSPIGQMNQTVTWSPVSRDSTIESSSQLLPILYGSDMMSDNDMNSILIKKVSPPLIPLYLHFFLFFCKYWNESESSVCPRWSRRSYSFFKKKRFPKPRCLSCLGAPANIMSQLRNELESNERDMIHTRIIQSCKIPQRAQKKEESNQ